MRAAVNTRYGSPDVLEIHQLPKPEPNAGEALIRIHATTVSRTNCGMLRPHPFFVRLVAGLRRPTLTVLGMDFAGVVETIGAGVAALNPGHRIFGLSPEVYGAHAEYLCVPETTALPTRGRSAEKLNHRPVMPRPCSMDDGNTYRMRRRACEIRGRESARLGPLRASANWPLTLPVWCHGM
jgi:NADPH:quinone reductase-like Zn-dependent oxidoreductase